MRRDCRAVRGTQETDHRCSPHFVQRHTLYGWPPAPICQRDLPPPRPPSLRATVTGREAGRLSPLRAFFSPNPTKSVGTANLRYAPSRAVTPPERSECDETTW